MIPPKFIYPSPDIPLRVPSNPCSVSGAPGKTYSHSARQTRKCTSPPYPHPLPLSGLAWPSSVWLLFSSSFSIDMNTVSWIKAVVNTRLWRVIDKVLRTLRPCGRRVLKFDGPSGRGLWWRLRRIFIAITTRNCLPGDFRAPLEMTGERSDHDVHNNGKRTAGSRQRTAKHRHSYHP